VTAQALAEAGEKVLAFVVGERRMAVPARQVREVAGLPPLTRVPFGAANLLGLGNFRGRVLPVLALERQAGNPCSRALLLGGERPVALAVNAVLGLAEADRAEDERLDIDAVLADAFPERARKAAAPAGTRLAGARIAAQGAAEEPVEDERVALLVMDLAGQRFALPADQVEEVLARTAEVAAIPGAHPSALGAMEHRGGVVPLFSLAGLLGLGDARSCGRGQVIVVRIGGGLVGLVVERVRAVLPVAHSRLEPVPGVLLRGASEAAIQAICRPGSGERLIGVLDADHLLASGADGLAAGAVSEPAPRQRQREDAGQPYLMLRAGRHRLAMPLRSVESVTLPQSLASIPDAPHWLAGMVNLRGTAVPVIDLSARLGEGNGGAGRRLVVSRRDGDAVGLLVDRVEGLIALSPDVIEHADAGGEADSTFDGYARLPGGHGGFERIALLVSPWTLIDAAHLELIVRAQGKARA
jgi:purine-binding chemotaxis protein CheW